MKISVVGLWHLGSVVSGSLVELGHTVTAIDFDHKTIEQLARGHMPADEPNLGFLIEKAVKSKKLVFSSNATDVHDSDVVCITFDTPISTTDEPDTKIIFDAVKKIAPFLQRNVLFVVMSQVPVGTTNQLAGEIRKINKKVNLKVVYSPENLQLGNAVECFLKPERIIIGADTIEAEKVFSLVVQKIKTQKIIMSVVSAEMTKHALNAFLATSLSFSYTISDLCEAVGADFTSVSKALKSDIRIGQRAYLDTSLGFSGGTLMRDLRALVKLGVTNKSKINLIEAVLDTNISRRSIFVSKLKKNLGNLKNKNICILGVTYKPGTSTLRRSLSVELITLLQKEGCRVTAYDPGGDTKEFYDETGLLLSDTVYESVKNAHGIVFVTPWPEFKKVDLKKVFTLMNKPYLFFDTRNVFENEVQKIKKIGFQYIGLGKGL